MQGQPASSTSFQIDPKLFLIYIIRYWYLVVIGLLAGISYAFYQVRYSVPTYSTNSRMLVKDEYSSWGQEYFLPGMELVNSRNRLVNEIGIIKSLPLMIRVSNKLKWDFSYYRIGNIKTTEMYTSSWFKINIIDGKAPKGLLYVSFTKNNQFYLSKSLDDIEKSEKFKIGEPFKLSGATLQLDVIDGNVHDESVFAFQSNSRNGWARQFQSSLNIDVENQESSILILSQNSRTPRKSIDFLNALMSEYIEWGKEQNNEIASNTIKFVDKQLTKIADSLIVTEHELEQFQKKNFRARIFIDTESSNLIQVKELEKILTERNTQKEYYSALIQTLKEGDYTAFPSTSVFGFVDLNIDKLIDQLRASIIERRATMFKHSENSVLIKKQEAEINSQKESLLEMAKMNYDEVVILIDSLKNRIEKEEQRVLQIPQEQRAYFSLKRDNKLLSDLYTYLLNKRSEASIAKASNTPNAQILDYADNYRVSYTGSNSYNTYTSAIVVGLVIPIGIIFLLYLLNNKIINPEDLKRITDIPIVGSVSHKSNLSSNIVVNDNLKSLISESFRSIRTNVNFMVSGKEKLKFL